MLWYYFFFFRSLFSSDRDFVLSRKGMFNQHSFALPGSANNDRLIVLRQLIRTLKNLWVTKVVKKDLVNGSASMYILNASEILDKKKYVESETSESVSNVFSKSSILGWASLFDKFVFTLYSLILSIFFVPAGMVSSRRVNIALIYEHLIGASLLYKYLRKTGASKLYYFFPHEPDANLLGFFLMQNGIEVIKIPVPTPLFMFNKTMIANKIVLSLGYQFEEAEEFLTIDKANLLCWKPEGLESYINEKFLDSTQNKKVCYYSHASWIRKSEDHNLPWINEVDMELNLLKSFRKKRNLLKGLDVFVCLHPKEKTSKKMIAKAEKYYKDIFGDKVIVADVNRSSFDLFAEFNIGIGALSTVLFQRMYCGYKTYMFNASIKEFPIVGSHLNKLVFKDESDLVNNLESHLNESPKDFYTSTGNYTFRFNQKNI